MIKTLFAVKDTVIDEYVSLHFFDNEVDFLRSIKSELLNAYSKLTMFPGDFQLYKLGSINTKIGSYEADHSFIASVIDVKREFSKELDYEKDSLEDSK